jgi:hypothetical protein
MLIRNHLHEPIIVNIRDKDEVVDINNVEHYTIDGIVIPAKGQVSVSIKSPYRKVVYFANVPLTKAGKLQLQFVTRDHVDVWDKSSDVAKCGQTGHNDGVSCRNSENIWLKWMLPKHMIFELYNPSTYVFALTMIGLLVTVIIIALIARPWHNKL